MSVLVQKKLRHVSRIVLRNLIVNESTNADGSAENKNDDARGPLDCYYTLSVDKESPPFYRSGVEHATLNPSWEDIPSLSHHNPSASLLSEMLIRVWEQPVEAEEAAPPPLLLEERIVLDDMESIHSLDLPTLQTMPVNSVLIFLPDGMYASSKTRQMLGAQKKLWGEADAYKSLEDRGAALNITSDGILQGLMKILSLQADMRKVQGETEEVCSLLTNEIISVGGCTRVQRRAAARARRRAELLGLCAEEERQLREERMQVQAQRQQAVPRCNELAGLFQQLAERRQAVQRMGQQLDQSERPRIKELDAKVDTRRRKMLYELSEIYSLSRRKDNNFICIRDLSLLGSLENERHANLDDDHIATALGYVCHLVIMLSKILDIPLRYRIVYSGSRSYICDDVHRWDYPLSLQSGQEPRFRWGRKLLNRNIEHILALRCTNWARAAKRNGDDDDSNILENLQHLFNEEIHSSRSL